MTRRSTSTYLLLSILFLLLVVSIGCGAAAEEDAIAFTLVERDGVPHAINEGENIWADSAAAPLQFELEQTFGTDEEPEEAMLAGVSSLVVDEEGVVYVLDAQNHRLVAFDADGSMRWSAGREGQGPSEFERPLSLVWDGENDLYVVNQSGARIDRWSTAGTHVEGISTEAFDILFMRLVGFSDGALVASASSMGGQPQRIFTIDTTTWTMEEQFATDLELDLPGGLGTSAPLAFQERTLYVGHVDRYEVSHYALDEGLRRRIVREVDYPVGPGVFDSNGQRGIISLGTLRPVGRLSNGYELVYVSWPTNVNDPDEYARRQFTDGDVDDPVYATSLDLFDAEGRLVGSLRWEDGRLPSIGRPLHLTSDDKLYTYHEVPFPQVRRYDVTVALE